MRRFIIIILLFIVGCDSCNEGQLTDSSCKPGDPASGEYNPRLPELCNNILDDNCDGRVNEGCACLDGETLTCGTDEGECARSTVVCQNGQWPECIPTKSPTAELCNLLDDDCDGITDNNVPNSECWQSLSDAVFEDPSICRKGTVACTNGITSCEGQVLPSREVCNQRDDDCDGQVDEESIDTLQKCGPSEEKGVCRFGHNTCHDGEVYCAGAVLSSAETCNGWDDNCNGYTDEDLVQRCETVCGTGTEICNNGSWIDCSAPLPEPEICDGEDNDCNGAIDDGLLCLCTLGDTDYCRDGMIYRDTGEPAHCGKGIKECLATGQWGQCYFFRASDEECNNWDDDCDGVIDSFTAECGVPPMTTGLCHSGTKICTYGQFSECEGSALPHTEVCNLLDDDCDGLTDENIRQHTEVDMVFAVDTSGSMLDYIESLKSAINTYASEFEDTPHRFSLVIFPGVANLTQYSYHPGMQDGILTVITDFVDVYNFQNVLAAITDDGGGDEPSIDVMYELASALNPNGLSWGANAYPYIILITDEVGQTWVHRQIDEVAAQTQTCQIAGCQTGDMIEVFILTHTWFFDQWKPVVYQDMTRLIDLDPPEEGRYLSVFRDIFAEICR